MKMLNPNFNEKKLNFSHWSDFVTAAVKAGFVTIEGKGAEALVYPAPDALRREGPQQKAFAVLLDVLKDLDKGDTTAYHSYRTVNSRLLERKVQFSAPGIGRIEGRRSQARGQAHPGLNNCFA
jgi:hypothetical protein